MNRIYQMLVALAVFLPSAGIALPAFPGAKGWGTETVGGRGGTVYVVTNTNSSGAGSFGEAFRATGPRIIVFRVSGPITVVSGEAGRIQANQSFLTVAGQTSPGGVTFVENSGNPILFRYNEISHPPDKNSLLHDCIFRHCRFRGKTTNQDGITFNSAWNYVFDHCDFSGGRDETVDMTYSFDFTLQWCTISNPVGNRFGMLIGYPTAMHITLQHVFFGHCHGRNPHYHCGSALHPPDSGQFEYINNVMYNGDYVAIDFGNLSNWDKLTAMNIVGNTFRDGPACFGKSPLWLNWEIKAYQTSNVYQRKEGTETRIWDIDYGDTIPDELCSDGCPDTVSTPWPMRYPPADFETSEAAYANVLAKGGAWPRDPMNTRTIQECVDRNGLQGVVSDALITGGPTPPADADMDGMPDFWETGMGLNPNSAADNTSDKDGDGYTNIEEYINDLANARVCEDYQNSVYPIPNNWSDYNPSCAKSLAAEAPSGLVNGPGALSASPNPFKTSTAIRNPGGRVQGLAVYDLTGKRVDRLSPAAGPTGGNSLVWKAQKFPSGVYIIRGVDNGRSVTLKLFLEK